MKCWYIYGEDCERHGICEGCPKYEKWREERNMMEKKMENNKKEI